MAARDKLKDDLVRAIPSLRAFALSLCGNPERADDLVQETLMKAWANLASFVEGTNLSAWLFTILRPRTDTWISRTFGRRSCSFRSASGRCWC
jgi:RNA polymerase sigma-70 factor (ECF subfamily)